MISFGMIYQKQTKYACKELWRRYLGTSPDRKTIVLHPILRIFFKSKQKEFIKQSENPEREFCYIMAFFARYIPQEANRDDIPRMQDSIIPHMEVAVQYIRKNSPASATWFDEADDDDEPITLLDPFMGLAKFYRCIGQPSEAIKWQKNCEEFLIDTFGEGHPLYSRCLNNLACLYNKEESYQRALESATKNLGEKHKITALIHRNFGHFYRKTQKDYQGAVEQLRAAVRIYSLYATSSNQYKRKKILSQSDLAQAQCRLRNFEAAQRFYSSSELKSFQEELKSSDTRDQMDNSRIEYDIAEFYRLRAKSNYATPEDVRSAARHSNKALEIRKENPQHETYVADSQIQLARIAKMQSKFCAAEGYYAIALQIYQAEPQTSDESLSRLKQEYNKLLREHRHLHLCKPVRWLTNQLKSS